MSRIAPLTLEEKAEIRKAFDRGNLTSHSSPIFMQRFWIEARHPDRIKRALDSSLRARLSREVQDIEGWIKNPMIVRKRTNEEHFKAEEFK